VRYLHLSSRVFIPVHRELAVWAGFTPATAVQQHLNTRLSSGMPSPAPPSSKRIPSTASSKQSGKKDPADDDDAKPYVIVNDIGKGSFATVYKGYHEVRILI
jgi:hypothetical protein